MKQLRSQSCSTKSGKYFPKGEVIAGNSFASETEMGGFGDFQRRQMRQVDPLIPELFRTIRKVTDVLERLAIQSRFARPEATVRPAPENATEGIATRQPVALTYSIKEICMQTSLGQPDVRQAIASGELRAVEYGHGTLNSRRRSSRLDQFVCRRDQHQSDCVECRSFPPTTRDLADKCLRYWSFLNCLRKIACRSN